MLLQSVLALRGLSDSQPPLAPLVFLLDLHTGLLVQLSHETGDVATTVIAEQLLVEQTVLLVVVELESAALLATEDRAKSLVDQTLRPDRQVLLKIVVESDAVVRILEELDILLKILQVQLLLSLEEERPVCLHSLKALGFPLQLHDGLFAGIYADVNLLQLAVVRVKTALVGDLNILKALAVISKALCMIDNRLVTVVDFLDKVVALSLVSFFKLAQLPHDIVGVLLQIFEDFRLDLTALVSFVNAPQDRLELIIALVFQDFALSLQVSKLHIDLLKYIQFSVGFEDGLLQIFHLFVDFLRQLLALVDAILVRVQLIDDGINQRLNQVSRLRLNVEPEELERRVFGRETLEVCRNQSFVLQISLPAVDLRTPRNENESDFRAVRRKI